MPRIIPIRDMRNTNRLSDMCHEKKEPVYVTKNGYSDLVVLSNEYFDELLGGRVIYGEIMKGAAQADRGQVIDGDEAMDSLRAKYGR